MQPTEQTERRALVMSLLIGGVVVIAGGIVAGALAGPALFAIAVLGIIDLGLAWMFHTGRLGTGRQPPGAMIGDDAGVAGNPSYNPYARED